MKQNDAGSDTNKFVTEADRAPLGHPLVVLVLMLALAIIMMAFVQGGKAHRALEGQPALHQQQ